MTDMNSKPMAGKVCLVTGATSGIGKVWVMGLFALSPEQGVDNTIYLASSPEVEGVTGKYFVEREPAQSSPLSYDEGVAQRLWQVSEDLTSG